MRLAWVMPSVARTGAAAVVDPLRQDLAARLRQAGLTVHEDYGNARQRIDLIVEDPYHRGRGLVAVETDGPRYAALRSTRDRDRLRPEQLERLGWHHLRVWSTDLFRDPAREIARIVSLAREDRRVGDPYDPDAVGETGGETGDEEQPTDDPAVAGADHAVSHPDDGADGADGADHTDPDAPGTAALTPARGRRRRRRVFRKGTGAAGSLDSADDYGPSGDELELGWGEAPADESSRDRWLEAQRPPHYE
jgi:hypothetical protein